MEQKWCSCSHRIQKKVICTRENPLWTCLEGTLIVNTLEDWMNSSGAQAHSRDSTDIEAMSHTTIDLLMRLIKSVSGQICEQAFTPTWQRTVPIFLLFPILEATKTRQHLVLFSNTPWSMPKKLGDFKPFRFPIHPPFHSSHIPQA